MRLDGKVAIVTGAASGIGRAIALRFAREGASVAINFRSRREDAAQVLQAIQNAGGKAFTKYADISVARDIAALVEETVATYGRLDIMINNAGFHTKCSFLETSEELWNSVIATNLTGTWLCSQIAARQMVKQGGGGRIVNISSVHEDLPMPTNAPYCTAKGGMLMMMRTIAVELAPHRITVNNVSPGAIDTPMDDSLKDHPEEMAALLREIPLGRMGQPEEVAALTTFLASDEAAYITGSSYIIDGGMLRQATDL